MPQYFSEIAESQPYRVYCAFTHRVSSQWYYLCWTAPNTCHLLSEMEVTIRHHLLPKISGRHPPSDFEKVLFSLPVKVEGQNFTPPVALECQYDHSYAISMPLVSLILSKFPNYSYDTVTDQITAIKANVPTNARLSTTCYQHYNLVC